MTRTKAIATICAVLIIGSVATVAANQARWGDQAAPGWANRKPMPTDTTTPADHGVRVIPSPLAELQAKMADPTKTYTIEPVPIHKYDTPRPPREERLLQAAATALRRVRPMPDARLQFFGWLDRPDSPLTRYGWHLSVQKVTPTPGGRLITVTVIPQVTMGGGHAEVFNSMAEEYLWSDDQIQFVRAYPLTNVEPMYGW
jgi:hypothetical protein